MLFMRSSSRRSSVCRIKANLSCTVLIFSALAVVNVPCKWVRWVHVRSSYSKIPVSFFSQNLIFSLIWVSTLSSEMGTSPCRLCIGTHFTHTAKEQRGQYKSRFSCSHGSLVVELVTWKTSRFVAVVLTWRRQKGQLANWETQPLQKVWPQPRTSGSFSLWL